VGAMSPVGPVSIDHRGASFDRCWGLSRHAADIANVTRLTDGVEKGLVIFGEQ